MSSPNALKYKFFIQKAMVKHNHEYRYPFDQNWWNYNYKNSNTRIDVICKRHGIFTTSVFEHLRGRGCPKCLSIIKRKKILNAFNRKKSPNCLANKNFILSNITSLSNKIPLQCQKCKKTIWQRLSYFLDGKKPMHKCLTGLNPPSKRIFKLTYDEFINRTNGINYLNEFKYLFDKIWWGKNFKGVKNTSVYYLCPKHGIIYQNVFIHLGGHGCPSCGKEISIQRMKKTKKNSWENVLITLQKNQPKWIFLPPGINKEWWYNSEEATNNFVFCAICNKHGSFSTNLNKLQQGVSCPICRLSKGEKKVMQFLIKKDIAFYQQYPVGKTKLKFDFFIEIENMAIEFDGRQHFNADPFFGGRDGQIKRVKNDIKKNLYCFDQKIELLRIPYWEFDNIEKILENNLLAQNKWLPVK